MNIADIRRAGKRAITKLSNLSFILQRENLQAVLIKVPRDVLIVIVLLLSCVGSFGLGVLTGEQLGKGGVVIETLPLAAAAAQAAPVAAAAVSSHGQVVASQNGSRYYLPNCAGAKRLSAAHKIWFSSVAKARAHGYTPAVHCKGL